MTEPTITCPNCKTEIKLNESLAAPLIEATRKQFEQQLAQKESDIAQREQAMRDKEKQLVEEKHKLPKKFADMSRTERIEACYQHVVLKFLSNSVMTNTSLRERLKIAEKQRAQVSRLIRDALDSGRIKLKDPHSKSSKFTEYLPYWS